MKEKPTREKSEICSDNRSRSNRKIKITKGLVLSVVLKLTGPRRTETIPKSSLATTSQAIEYLGIQRVARVVRGARKKVY